MKPVGLRDPRTRPSPLGGAQLRAENAQGSLYNLVGFQTNLKFGEQRRVFGMIPALARAEYARYGVKHRNTFLDSPRLLTPGYHFREEPRLLFAGQMTGVEGYMESAASGILAGKNAARMVRGPTAPDPAPGHHDRGAGGVYQRSRCEGFSANGGQLRHSAAAGGADSGQAPAVRRPGAAGAGLPGGGAGGSGEVIWGRRPPHAQVCLSVLRGTKLAGIPEISHGKFSLPYLFRLRQARLSEYAAG